MSPKTAIFIFCLVVGLTIFYFVSNFNYFSFDFLIAGISSLFNRENTQSIIQEPLFIEKENNSQAEEAAPEEGQIEEKNIELSDVEEIQNKIDDTLEQIDILEAELAELLSEQSPIEEEIKNIEKEDGEEKIEENDLEKPEEKIEEKTENLAEEEIGQGEAGQTLCFKIAGFLPNRNKIIINEVAWMGTLESQNNEWIELKNISNDTVNLSGWQLLDKEVKIKIFFNDKNVILPNGFLLLERTDDNSVPYIPADLIYTGALNDTDEELYLFDENCNLEDEVLAAPDWPAGDKTEKRTMERKDNLDWQTSLNIGGTPKAQNSIGFVIVGGGSGGGGNTAPSEPTYCPQENLLEPTYSPIIFDEIAWMGTSVNYSNEWFELKNISEDEVSLESWQILDKAGQIKIVFKNSDTIPANSFYLLERTDDNSVPNIPADKIYTGSLGDEEESLRIFDKNCNLIDEVTANPDWPAGNKLERRSMERDKNLSWHTYFGEGENGIMGTPKKENSEEIKDTTPPIVIFNPINSPQIKLSFSISWSAEDPVGNTTPSGIDGFFLQYTTTPSLDGVFLQYQNENNWEDWITGEEIEAKSDSLNILGKDEYNYSFQIKAKDGAGNWSLVDSLSVEIKIPQEEEFINKIVINEIGWMGTEASSSDEWIELYNPTNKDINIFGWHLTTGDGSPNIIFGLSPESANVSTTTILQDGFYLLERTDDNTISDILADWFGSFGQGGLKNTGEKLELYDDLGNPIDSVDCSSGWFSGKSGPDYISMERIAADNSGNESQNWGDNDLINRIGHDATGNLINGTPKSKNSISF